MRLRPAITTAMLMVLVILAGCSRDEPEPLVPPLTAESVTAEVLWERLTVDTDYTNYDFWPGHEGENPGQSPHGAFHRIYVNRTIMEALPIADRIAPNGTLIVKDNLNTARELDSIVVMAKIDGFDPENGDWYWASYMPDGTARAAGALSGCIACHEGVAGNDYVILRSLDAPLAP